MYGNSIPRQAHCEANHPCSASYFVYIAMKYGSSIHQQAHCEVDHPRSVISYALQRKKRTRVRYISKNTVKPITHAKIFRLRCNEIRRYCYKAQQNSAFRCASIPKANHGGQKRRRRRCTVVAVVWARRR